MSDPKYVVGIDLGTTNSVVAYSEISDDELEIPPIQVLKIPQLVDAGSIDQLDVLPSFILLPGPNDVPEDSLALPWNSDMTLAVGEYARHRGVEIPHRMIASSKSWLCNVHVDRNEKILPWDGPDPKDKLSPVEASAEILKHIRAAWDDQMANDNDDNRLENQDVYLTVPASFDAVARDLTVKAAELAGLKNITLLEEPQAAFYAWIDKCGDKWRKKISVGDMILVCDIGGGTTDYSLIQVSDENGELILERIAVGNHLLVGGDNMDIALSHILSRRLAEEGKKLDAWQMRSLWHSCRQAKEQLYENKRMKTCPITIMGRGSSLIASTIKTKITMDDLDQAFHDGFFPICEKDTKALQFVRTGMREMGLVYESDPAITHHLAEFLSKQQKETSDSLYPTAVLFNGGVMKATPLRNRILEVLSLWNNNSKVRDLGSKDFDLAVACGAAYYGRTRHGKGVRIRGGLSKAYYIGVEASLPSVPGIPTPLKALCVAPFGMEEGSQVNLTKQEFGLIVGEPVKFEFLGTTIRKQDVAGTILDSWENENISGITTLETQLDGDEGTVIPVTLEIKVTEIGTLELWCVSQNDGKKWKLEFNVREKEQTLE